jgi:hypothetical protein
LKPEDAALLPLLAALNRSSFWRKEAGHRAVAAVPYRV